MIEIRPGLNKYLEKRSFALKKWRYINNIPTIKEMVDQIKDDFNDNKHADTYTYNVGIARFVPPIEWEKGKAMMTPYGIGKIRAVEKDYLYPNQIQRVVLEMMTTNFRKSRGYIKYFKPSALSQLVVYHQPSSQFILISPKDYVYIVDENAEITYRVTRRSYATLSPDYKVNVGYIKVFNDYRGGANILKRLQAKGYVIVKQ